MTNWREGTRMDLFLTAANELGYENAPLAWGLSNVGWQSKQDMESFLRALTTTPMMREGEDA